MEGAESSGSEVGNEDVMEIQVVSVDYSFFWGGGAGLGLHCCVRAGFL